MSVERSFEAWEEVQRHGQDLADKLAQGFTGLIQSHISPPSFAWPNPPTTKIFDVEFEFPTQNLVPRDFGLAIDNSGFYGIFDIGNRIGQAGADFGACVNGLVQQFFRLIPVPFMHNDNDKGMVKLHHDDNSGQRSDMSILVREELGSLAEQWGDFRFSEKSESGVDGVVDDELSGFNLKLAGLFGKSQGTVNVTSSYDSRTRDVQSSVAARGDLWRLEASSGTSVSGSQNSSLFLVQLGPLLFIRDTTLLLPVHLSKQHLLWYGYDRKNGLHSLCPAVWTKHRRWLLMSMICLNPLACSFMDLQFPNGQLTYVAGEGLTTSAFVPVFGGLLQAQGQYPGEMRFSFSTKNKWGTQITPMIQWPDRSFTLGFVQDLAWKRTGLLVRPTVQFSLSPTFGGSDPGLRAEFAHSVKDQLNLIYGCSFSTHPSAFASVSLGRSKWNGNVGSTGIVMKVETPLCNNNVGRPAFSVQLNSGIEF
ncbi:Chromosome partition protein MukB [Bienertia sinuspersici]